MKEDALAKKIHKEAKIYGYRAIKSPEDEKRHDRVKIDEQRAMRLAHERLGWSDAKIGTVFYRDPRTIHRYLQLPEPTLSQPEDSTEHGPMQQLIQRWRVTLESLLPIQLLQRELGEAAQEALSDYFSDEGERETNRRVSQQHSVKVTLQLRFDPAYSALHQRFPKSKLLGTLNASLDTWGECVPTYMSAFFNLMHKVKEWVKLLMDSLPHQEAIKTDKLSVHINSYRKQRSYAVLITCDLLRYGLLELTSHPRWMLLNDDLEKLRIRVNLELSSIIKKTQKGGWPSNAALIWNEPGDPSGLVHKTKVYLSELSKLRTAQDSIEKTLQELESRSESLLSQ